MSINFSLSALDVNIIMSTSGEFIKIPFETITADATADFYVKTSDIRNVFMFQSDSDDIDTITSIDPPTYQGTGPYPQSAPVEETDAVAIIKSSLLNFKFRLDENSTGVIAEIGGSATGSCITIFNEGGLKKLQIFHFVYNIPFTFERIININQYVGNDIELQIVFKRDGDGTGGTTGYWVGNTVSINSLIIDTYDVLSNILLAGNNYTSVGGIDTTQNGPIAPTNLPIQYFRVSNNYSSQIYSHKFYYSTLPTSNSSDIKYFIRQKQWPNGLIINPCNAWVSSGQIATTDRLGVIEDYKELVKHDFIRHIAKSLFGTHLGVDLFNNEDELKYDLTYKGYYTAWNNIWNSMTSISDLSLNTTSYSGLYGNDASYGYYLTDDCSSNVNITRQLLNQIILNKPERLQNLNTYVVDASKGFYLIPLIDGDSILFKLTLNPAPNQHLLLNKTSPLPSRTYKIRINLVSSVTNNYKNGLNTNIIPNDLKPTYYNGSSSLLDLNNTFPSNYTIPRYMKTLTDMWFKYMPKTNLYLYEVLNSSGEIAYTPNITEINRLVKNVKMSSDVTSYMNKGLLTSISKSIAGKVSETSTNLNVFINIGRLFQEILDYPLTASILNGFPINYLDIGEDSNNKNRSFRFSFIFKPISTTDNKFVISMGNRTGVYGIYIINVETMDVIEYITQSNNWDSTLSMGSGDRTLTFNYVPNNRYLVFMFMSTSYDSINNNGISYMNYQWKYNSFGSLSSDFSQFDYPIFNYNF